MVPSLEDEIVSCLREGMEVKFATGGAGIAATVTMRGAINYSATATGSLDDLGAALRQARADLKKSLTKR